MGRGSTKRTTTTQISASIDIIRAEITCNCCNTAATASREHQNMNQFLTTNRMLSSKGQVGSYPKTVKLHVKIDFAPTNVLWITEDKGWDCPPSLAIWKLWAEVADLLHVTQRNGMLTPNPFYRKTGSYYPLSRSSPSFEDDLSPVFIQSPLINDETGDRLAQPEDRRHPLLKDIGEHAAASVEPVFSESHLEAMKTLATELRRGLPVPFAASRIHNITQGGQNLSHLIKYCGFGLTFAKYADSRTPRSHADFFTTHHRVILLGSGTDRHGTVVQLESTVKDVLEQLGPCQANETVLISVQPFHQFFPGQEQLYQRISPREWFPEFSNLWRLPKHSPSGRKHRSKGPNVNGGQSTREEQIFFRPNHRVFCPQGLFLEWVIQQTDCDHCVSHGDAANEMTFVFLCWYTFEPVIRQRKRQQQQPHQIKSVCDSITDFFKQKIREEHRTSNVSIPKMSLSWGALDSPLTSSPPSEKDGLRDSRDGETNHSSDYETADDDDDDYDDDDDDEDVLIAMMSNLETTPKSRGLETQLGGDEAQRRSPSGDPHQESRKDEAFEFPKGPVVTYLPLKVHGHLVDHVLTSLMGSSFSGTHGQHGSISSSLPPSMQRPSWDSIQKPSMTIYYRKKIGPIHAPIPSILKDTEVDSLNAFAPELGLFVTEMTVTQKSAKVVPPQHHHQGWEIPYCLFSMLAGTFLLRILRMEDRLLSQFVTPPDMSSGSSSSSRHRHLDKKVGGGANKVWAESWWHDHHSGKHFSSDALWFLHTDFHKMSPLSSSTQPCPNSATLQRISDQLGHPRAFQSHEQTLRSLFHWFFQSVNEIKDTLVEYQQDLDLCKDQDPMLWEWQQYWIDRRARPDNDDGDDLSPGVAKTPRFDHLKIKDKVAHDCLNKMSERVKQKYTDAEISQQGRRFLLWLFGVVFEKIFDSTYQCAKRAMAEFQRQQSQTAVPLSTKDSLHKKDTRSDQPQIRERSSLRTKDDSQETSVIHESQFSDGFPIKQKDGGREEEEEEEPPLKEEKKRKKQSPPETEMTHPAHKDTNRVSNLHPPAPSSSGSRDPCSPLKKKKQKKETPAPSKLRPLEGGSKDERCLKPGPKERRAGGDQTTQKSAETNDGEENASVGLDADYTNIKETDMTKWKTKKKKQKTQHDPAAAVPGTKAKKETRTKDQTKEKKDLLNACPPEIVFVRNAPNAPLGGQRSLVDRKNAVTRNQELAESSPKKNYQNEGEVSKKSMTVCSSLTEGGPDHIVPSYASIATLQQCYSEEHPLYKKAWPELPEPSKDSLSQSKGGGEQHAASKGDTAPSESPTLHQSVANDHVSTGCKENSLTDSGDTISNFGESEQPLSEDATEDEADPGDREDCQAFGFTDRGPWDPSTFHQYPKRLPCFERITDPAHEPSEYEFNTSDLPTTRIMFRTREYQNDEEGNQYRRVGGTQHSSFFTSPIHPSLIPIPIF